ncbi:ATP-dependent Clp protease proteolytic subunit [Pseudomonas sp. Y24-6]|uniref:ATP-dependent Clp protease proteolytic subunit n=1 Tax=Pseudomonas sp. Y24-6 TaxID=2750013 RepID=UPI001CE0614C|nr:ATP-dependent Clp protease proteolytic subunit [Pseudomonas sp. Y24-6]MCA4964494.1 ATP-dependent Clp protease proteolytic subunit [Pseudomonas sp. Y24-6]
MKHQANSELVELHRINRPKNILAKQRVSTHYVVPLTGPIGEIDGYGEFVHILAHAGEEDQVYIQLSSPGGSLETCDYLCRRMEECEAHVTVEIGMTCASAASAIALQADDWVIYDSSTMMIHSCSYSPGYGKESDVRAMTEYTDRLNREWIERTYQGFLFEDELFEAVDCGKDLYLYADDLRQRMPLLKEYRKQCKARRFEEAMRHWSQKDAA